MRFMILLTANAVTESGGLPSPELLAQMGAYNEKLVSASVLKDAGGLTPTAGGARVRFSGQDRKVVQGPFAATERAVAGHCDPTGELRRNEADLSARIGAGA